MFFIIELIVIFPLFISIISFIIYFLISNKSLKKVSLIFGLIFLFIPISFIGYYVYNEYQAEKEAISYYHLENTDYYIDLKENMTWETNFDSLKIKEGRWSFYYSDDYGIIKLKGYSNNKIELRYFNETIHYRSDNGERFEFVKN